MTRHELEAQLNRLTILYGDPICYIDITPGDSDAPLEAAWTQDGWCVWQGPGNQGPRKEG